MIEHIPHLEELPNLKGKRVLLRADFNVPLTDGPSGRKEIADDHRILSALPTIKWLQEQGAHVTACSHLGRPGGEPNPDYSMDPIREKLDQLAPGVDLLQNLRFYPGEESNDPAFVQRLIKDQDIYVNDAFGVAHRAHASVVGPPQFLPSAAGRLLAKEVDVITFLLDSPARPFVAILGGAKVSDKLNVIKALMDKVDVLIVGGGMCFTFLAALGHEIGSSLFEPDQVDNCRHLIDSGKRIIIPTDVVALGPGGKIGAGSSDPVEVKDFGREIPKGWMGLDIGPQTIKEFTLEISTAGSVFWNGPMGVFEDDRFETGTKAIAQAVADCKGFTVVGGGDSAAALAYFGLEEQVDHLSTGGGASLELIEKGDLPGLAALRSSKRS